MEIMTEIYINTIIKQEIAVFLGHNGLGDNLNL